MEKIYLKVTYSITAHKILSTIVANPKILYTHHMIDLTLEEIKQQFENFKAEFGHYPTRHDIKNSDYITTSVKSIERKWGGLRNLRQLLGLDQTEIDGRSKNKFDINVSYENYNRIKQKVEDMGLDKYPVFEVISPQNRQSLSSCMRNQIMKYRTSRKRVAIIIANGNLTEEDVNAYLLQMKGSLPENISVIMEWN